MTKIQSAFLSKSDIIPALTQILKQKIEIDESSVSSSLSRYTSSLKEDIYAFLEYPYIDKVFRDSYYNYYSKKHFNYSRDCVRVSLFDKKVEDSDFRDLDKIQKTKKAFLGFFIIRPLPNHLWGRSILAPRAFKRNNFVCCLSKYSVSVNGLKMSVSAFPHSSQDAETLTCAETAIWGLMEYFGYKYAEYAPVLPSAIINVLSKFSYERQIPSHGLTCYQISYVLKAFGFGVKMYANNDKSEIKRREPDNDFFKIFSYYIESGVPIIGIIENANDAHAIIINGRGVNIENNIDSVVKPDPIDTKKGPLVVYDSAVISKDVVIMDDNLSGYSLAPFNQISKHYPSSKAQMIFTYIVVPLYPKIYSDARMARRLIFELHNNYEIDWETSEIVLRFFLSSSRSFKDELIKNTSLDETIKALILEIDMPRFIWIAEISDKSLFKLGKVKGLILLDATETYSRISLLFIIQPNKFTYNDNGKLLEIKLKIDKFDNLKNNLKGEWNQWEI